MNNIDNLLKDISIRHASKNVDKYVADVEKAIGIKIVHLLLHSIFQMQMMTLV